MEGGLLCIYLYACIPFYPQNCQVSILNCRYIWNYTIIYMSVGRKLQFSKRTSSNWGVPYRLSVFDNPSYLCIVGNSKILSNGPGNSNGCVKQSFCCERGGLASSSWLYVAILLASFRCLCWALLLRLTNCVGFFDISCWMSASSACSLHFRSEPPDTKYIVPFHLLCCICPWA